MQKRYKNPLLVGVTGGIGSGQSTVCDFLKKRRCKVINADIKAKEVIQKNRGLQADLKKTFGNDIFGKNGKLNNRRLAELAFSNEAETQKLNQLVHPRMVENLVEEMERARFSGNFQIIVIDAALIYEICIERMFDQIIVVDAPMPERMRRVKERDGMTQRQFKDRADKQIPLSEKVKWADFVIKNNDSLESLEKKTMDVYHQLVQLQKKQERKKIN